jgi:hypothetical protein
MLPHWPIAIKGEEGQLISGWDTAVPRDTEQAVEELLVAPKIQLIKCALSALYAYYIYSSTINHIFVSSLSMGKEGIYKLIIFIM